MWTPFREPITEKGSWGRGREVSGVPGVVVVKGSRTKLSAQSQGGTQASAPLSCGGGGVAGWD